MYDNSNQSINVILSNAMLMLDVVPVSALDSCRLISTRD